METTDDVKQAFAVRLHQLCDEMGVVAERGRQTALGNQFHVSPSAARKWLRGQGMPELDMAIRIAQWADVNILWLLQGAGPKRGDKMDTGPGELLAVVNELPDDDTQQVFDFIRYKIERADGWFAREKVGRYIALLDKIAEQTKGGKK